jgi:molecular chaperone HtpG
MRPGQEAIYTLSGDAATLAASPQLEGFRAKGVEVLLLTDPIDEFWVPAVRTYRDKPFKSAAGADTDLGRIAAPEPADAAAAPADLDRLIQVMKGALGDAVKDVRVSERLTDSPVCLVAGTGDMDMYLERLLRQHRRLDGDAPTPRILEVNPRHPLIRQMAAAAALDDAAAALADLAHLLLDQARIVEGDRVADPMAFARRLSTVMGRHLPPPPG